MVWLNSDNNDEYQNMLVGPVAVTTPGVDCIPGVIGSTSPNKLNPPLENPPPPKILVGATIGEERGGVITGVIAEIAGTVATEAYGDIVAARGGGLIVMGIWGGTDNGAEYIGIGVIVWGIGGVITLETNDDESAGGLTNAGARVGVTTLEGIIPE